MADFDNRALRSRATPADLIDTGLRSYMLRVYNYMLIGLALTGVMAFVVSQNDALLQLFFQADPATGRYGLSILGWIVTLAPVGLVLFMSMRIQSMSLGAAQATFWIYAALVGVSLAPIMLLYAHADIAIAFFTTAATFGAMSLWGYTTRTDLTGFGSFLFMGLIGVVIASVVNIFLQSAMMTFVISIVGVLVFTGLTAYDTQAIKSAYSAGDDSATAGKKAIYGALKLYLDFLNLFLMILRLMGNGRR